MLCLCLILEATASKIKKFSEDFEALVNNILKIMDKPGNLDKFKLVCFCIATENPLLFSKEESAAIQAKESVSKVFDCLRDHWRWDSHQLLSTVVELNESQDALQELKGFQNQIDYAIKLNEFCQLHEPPLAGYTKMRAIIEKDYSQFTLQECINLDKHLASVFGSTALHPPFYEQSNSIQVTWHILTESVNGLLNIAYRIKEQLFQLFSISFFQIHDVVILNKKWPYLPEVRVCIHMVNYL